jgi:hypothetical protein
MLSLTGKIKVSSLLPQYFITAIFVGVCAVTILTHGFPAIDNNPQKASNFIEKKVPEQRSEDLKMVILLMFFFYGFLLAELLKRRGGKFANK